MTSSSSSKTSSSSSSPRSNTEYYPDISKFSGNNLWTPSKCIAFIDKCLPALPCSFEDFVVKENQVDQLKSNIRLLISLGWLSDDRNGDYQYGERYKSCQYIPNVGWKYVMTTEESQQVEQKIWESINKLRHPEKSVKFSVSYLVREFPGVLDFDTANKLLSEDKFGLSYYKPEHGSMVFEIPAKASPTLDEEGNKKSKTPSQEIDSLVDEMCSLVEICAIVEEKSSSPSCPTSPAPPSSSIDSSSSSSKPTTEAQTVSTPFSLCIKFDRSRIVDHFQPFCMFYRIEAFDLDGLFNQTLAQKWGPVSWSPVEMWCALELMNQYSPAEIAVVFKAFNESNVAETSWRYVPPNLLEALNPRVILSTMFKLKSLLYPFSADSPYSKI